MESAGKSFIGASLLGWRLRRNSGNVSLQAQDQKAKIFSLDAGGAATMDNPDFWKKIKRLEKIKINFSKQYRSELGHALASFALNEQWFC